ncbi:hypothetical protein E6R61_05710 [Streptomyces sp. LRa12]|uniref:hypothetical protein n=1 Tax=Streptomyces sp. LRa12 TaxID=2563107 RepID=UPI00109EDA06|nr:hypothetical protein [Streptomyces sp. LRa12]THA98841.1 hypothetical protein E6R61_05710 [Streptomyces sp. LRa12]
MNDRLCGACGKPLPADADRRRTTCDDACRKRANRLKRASAAVVPLRPQDAAQRDTSRHDDLRDLWARIVASIATQGVLVPGSAGVPVAHPALRFVAQIDAQLLKHEMHPAETGSDDLDALIAKALRVSDDEGKAV